MSENRAEGPTTDQVNARAAELAAEQEPPPHDPRRQAEALLAESEARVEDPAASTPGDDDVVRRTSDEGMEP